MSEESALRLKQKERDIYSNNKLLMLSKQI